MTENTIMIMPAALNEYCLQVLLQTGLPEEDAALLAEILIEADLRGVNTHGVNLLPRYVRGFLTGNLNKEPRLKIIRDSPVVTLLDGNNGIGQVL